MVKRVTKGDLIAEPGYFYTVEEHQKAETHIEAIRELKTIFKEEETTEKVESKPVGATV